jgi:hypothetical protein
MSVYHFCTGCEFVKTRQIAGHHGPGSEELSCPARFNPREGKWLLTDGVNPHECPRNENFLKLQNQNSERRLR